MLINLTNKITHKTDKAAASSLAPSHSQILLPSGKWKSAEKSSSSTESLTLDYKQTIQFNTIQIAHNEAQKSHFPSSFRIEISRDGKEWEVIFTENGFTPDNDPLTLNLPLLSARFVRLFVTETPGENGNFFAETESVSIGIAGIASISGATDSSADKRKDLLFDGKPDTFFETEGKSSSEKISLMTDLGLPFMLSKLTLTAAQSDPAYFPFNFSVELSADKKIWSSVVEQKKFTADNGGTYSWTFPALNARYLRIEMTGTKSPDGKALVRLSEMGIFAAPSEVSHFHTETTPPIASVFQPGLVKIAKDAEITDTAVVRADDRRLRDASTLFKGIVQFADNGSCGELLAVQGSDDRLKAASESAPGIVRLAYDRESNSGAVVQGSDSRLQEASEKQFGIVRLCPDGELSDMGVVRGSDSRLKKASEKSYGICMLAGNEQTEPGTVVQANDKRLKDATIFSKGIVQFSDDGEAAENKAVMSSDKRLKDATTSSKGIVELADDGETTPGTVVQANDKRLKDATTSAKGIVELADDGETKSGVAVQGSDKRLLDASEKNKGIVILAKDGESAANKAVQSNDKRLKDATTTAKGIVELAEDGETSEGVAVQGNDKRLKDATIQSKGIVRFAANGESSALAAVQGDDDRLKDATSKNKGIVRLADNGESAPNAALQSNDDRIKNATEDKKGIVALCKDGSDTIGCAVQGNDKRLKNGTENSHGIVRFASDKGTEPLTAVQGNDERLKEATTLKKGIVELADDGEDTPGTVVQGSDKRLKNASEENFGIMRFAKNGESKQLFAVQSDDRRLSDKRDPLPHEHDYAPASHDFNSHKGSITLKLQRNESFTGVTPPPSSGAVIYAENDSKEKGSAALTGVAGKATSTKNAYGVIGHSSYVGVRGQSTGIESGEGCGVLGISRFGAGGVFASEHSYAIIADGHGSLDSVDPTLKLIGEGKALLVNGQSCFNGQIVIETKSQKNPEYPSNIVEMHPVDDADFTSAGDLLIISEKGAMLAKTHQPYCRAVIGVVSGNPSITINNNGKQEKLYPIALHGTVICKVDARTAPINPGDVIVTSSTPGCGMKGTIDSFDKIGSVIGKALTGLSEGTGTIQLIIAKN